MGSRKNTERQELKFADVQEDVKLKSSGAQEPPQPRLYPIPSLSKLCMDPASMMKQASVREGLFRGLSRAKTFRIVADPERIPQPTYLGLEIEVDKPNNEVRWGVCAHDGSWSLDYYDETLEVGQLNSFSQKLMYFEDSILADIREYQQTQNYKTHLVGVGLRVCDASCVDYGIDRMATIYGPANVPSLASRLWLELDAIPYLITSKGRNLDERASSGVRKAVATLSPQVPGNVPRVQVGYRNRVEVDGDGEIHLVDLKHYQNHCKNQTWVTMHRLAKEIREKNLKAAFFNSTPQGGGVALMRHALIRLCRLLGLDVSWYVTNPSPEVFNVTKRKFHNVLQGVAPPEVRLTAEDKNKFLEWTKTNVERHWDDADGPFMTCDVIVIDDPQVSYLIPYIRNLNPKCRIVYRSHIEVRSDLIRNDPKGPQAETWEFLWSAIQHADVFISHPVSYFIPDNVPRDHVVYLPAATDPLDGLNKELSDWSTVYYRQVFNRVCFDQGGRPVDWKRPYVVQVARFDPSKGIPDVIDAFSLLLHRMYPDDNRQQTDPHADAHANGPKDKKWGGFRLWGRAPSKPPSAAPPSPAPNNDLTRVPQLVICGHGSVDDPDGTLVYEQAHEILSSPEYSHIKPHVSIARIPPCDQLLNVALRGAYVALQLSHKEGFEVKVTEAIFKGVPMVAYRAGGIPFQIEHGKNGFLVDVGNTEGVADCLYKLFEDKDMHRAMSRYARDNVTDEYFTQANLTAWMYMWLKLTQKPPDVTSGGLDTSVPELNRVKLPSDKLGNNARVHDLWWEEYVDGGEKSQ